MRFVVLHHVDWDGHADHYDLLLEFREGDEGDARALKAFASLEDRFPVIDDVAVLEGGSQRVEGSVRLTPARATEVLMRAGADHRRMYLHYEGVVRGGRGRVMRVDEGALLWIDGPEGDGAQYRFELQGGRLRGRFGLKRVLGAVEHVFRLTSA